MASDILLARSLPVYLPNGLLDRLRASLGGRAVLSCASLDALVAAATDADARAVVIDPVLCGPLDRLSDTLCDALGRHVPIVLYTTQVSPVSIRLCFAGARAGAHHLLLAGIDDDVIRLRTVFDGLLCVINTEAVVEQLDGRLALLPPRLASAVRRLFVEAIVPDLDDLAASSYMSKRSVDRWLQRAGLAPPKRFLGAARLIRAHGVLAAGEMSLARAARHAGFSSPRSLALHARTLVGVSPAALRALHADQLHERVALRLREA
jgi:AraC-like DNA-binding protein